jgi:hypothetical protein
VIKGNNMEYVLMIMVLVGLGVALGKWADSKGYGFWNWFFASSVLGLIWMAFLPNTKDAKYTADEAEKQVKKGNTTGIVLAILAQGLTIVQLSMLNGLK